MKKLLIFALVLTLMVSIAGCTEKEETGKKGSSLSGSGIWESVSGSYTRKDSSQYNNAVLQMKYLSNDCAMFEFRLMEGSESEDSSDTLVLPFVMVIENSVGKYESLPDSKNPLTITFALSKDGKQVTVAHKGELSISPDGVYNFTNSELEVSEVSATAIIDHLPTAATSLNHNNGAYTLKYPDELLADWFYPVQAVFDDSGAVLAKFLIAKDLSAVYRADDDIEPVLIFGEAHPTIDPVNILSGDDGDWSEQEGRGDIIDEAVPEGADVIRQGVFYYKLAEMSGDYGDGLSPRQGAELADDLLASIGLYSDNRGIPAGQCVYISLDELAVLDSAMGRECYIYSVGLGTVEGGLMGDDYQVVYRISVDYSGNKTAAIFEDFNSGYHGEGRGDLIGGQ